MHFGLSPEQEKLRAEVAAFLDREVTQEIADEFELGRGPAALGKELYKKVGAKGYLTVTWPKKYGGLEGHHTDQLIVSDELNYRRVPSNRVGSSMAGPTILMFGSDEIKNEYLPKIAAGEIEFALGYTEPEAGSDLASLQIRAVEDGDDYVVNGSKIFNTATHYSDYHWLGARTNPDVPKHKGVSLFVVDLKSPGITIKPLWTLAGGRTNVVYYDNVRVPKRNLVGEKDRGFYHIATALDFERMFPTGEIRRDLDELIIACREMSVGGKVLGKDPLVRQRIAELAAEVEALTLLSYRMIWQLDQGIIPNYESSMLKMYGTEVRVRMATAQMQIFGPASMIRKGSKLAPIDGRPAITYLNGYIGTIVAGTSEIQRNIIATRGLGLPR